MWIPLKRKKNKTKTQTVVRGTFGCSVHNLNWKLDAEQVFVVVISQFPLHNQLYLEMQESAISQGVQTFFNIYIKQKE